MYKHVVFRIFAGLVLLAAMAGIAFFAYQAGVAHGVVANPQAPAGQANGSPYLQYGMPFWYFAWFPGFGFFGLLVPLFLLFLVIGMFRLLIWGPRWRWRHMNDISQGTNPWKEGVPPMFAEWHRRAHAGSPDNQPPENKPGQ